MNYSRVSSITRFALLIMAILLVCSITVCGVYINDENRLQGIFEDGTIRLGLDLAGGSIVTFQAETEETGDDLDAGMQSVYTVMRDRLDGQGLTEALCYLTGDDMITIEIPDVDDPNEAIANFMQTAKLQFKDSSGNVVLEGEHVESAFAGSYPVKDGVYEIAVSLSLTDEGAARFQTATKAAAAKKDYIGIYIDGVAISQPTVNEEITDGQAIITGNFTMEEATALANNINAGAFRYELKPVEQRTVGATLGENSLSTSLIAGAIGVLLVIIFMCIYYKVPGCMASIALIAYMGIFGLVLTLTQANLTLAGIAGIFLSIGMAVDANVVIFERMKEEIDAGKSAKAAIKGGFKRAFTAILDSNVTTIIACAVLYFLGSGTIKGFATTLFIGIVISLLTALLITRALLYLAVGMGVTEPKKFRALGKGKLNFHFIKKQVISLSIVAVVLVVGVVSFIAAGFNIDIDFSGGTEIKIDLGTEVTDTVCNEINDIIKNHELLGNDYVSSTTQSTDNSNMAIIRTGTAALSNEQTLALQEAILNKYENADATKVQITTIAPTIGDNLTKSAIIAVIVAVVLMLVYIWIRFELKSGIAAVICLCHDLFVMFVFYSLLQIPVNSNIIAALLTILGYSINATIIVFDRVRENKAKAEAGTPFSEIINLGAQETFGRSLNTTLTTLFTIGMIFILGVDSIQAFALPLIIGVVAGLFSSVFLSGVIWNALDKIGGKKQN